MSSILIATDGSEHAKSAVELVASIAWPSGTTVSVVAVVPSLAELAGLPWTLLAPSNMDEEEAAELRRAESATWAAVDTLRRVGLTAHCQVVRGHPADVIVELAQRQHSDLIVIGSRGLGSLQSAILGSVSAQVVDRAPCAVLVARTDRVGRAVIADDGSPEAEAARAFVLERPHLLGSEARLVGVMSTETLWPDMLVPLEPRSYEMLVETHTAVRHALTGRLAVDAAELMAAGIPATAETRDGNPAHEIVAAAEACEAGLIVIGTHGRRGVTRLAIGSVSRAVVHGAHCSVLVVHRQPSDLDHLQERPDVPKSQPARA